METHSLHPPGLPQPLQHPQIGNIQGRYNKGVIQYLGIQYASLKNRFADPEVVNYSGHEWLHATKHGYVCVSTRVRVFFSLHKRTCQALRAEK